LLSGLRATCRGSVWGQEVSEVLGEHIGGSGGEHIYTVHRYLVLNAIRDDVAQGDGLEVDLVVRCHHTERLLDPQMKGAAHALGDMPAEGA
jgi:hypothetical protein